MINDTVYLNVHIKLDSDKGTDAVKDTIYSDNFYKNIREKSCLLQQGRSNHR